MGGTLKGGKELLEYVLLLNRTRRWNGLQPFCREHRGRLPGERTLYRWHRALGDDMQFFPSANFEALGLANIHLFIRAPRAGWEDLAVAVESAWLIRESMQRILYLHCLVPSKFLESFSEMLQEARSLGLNAGVRSYPSGDGWQVMEGLRDNAEGTYPCAAPSPPSCPGNGSAWKAVRGFPFILAVLFENFGRRMSLEAVWKAAKERLDGAVWKFLPGWMRRYSVNGKTYVKRAYKAMNEYGLFRQNLVRYRQLLEDRIEIFMLVGKKGDEVLRDTAGICQVAEVYPGGKEGTLCRLICDVESFYRLLRLSMQEGYREAEFLILDKETSWQSRHRARFRYEMLFDRARREWVFPREEILKSVMPEGVGKK